MSYETFKLPGDHDQTLFLYTTEAGTSSREALDLLASWSLPADRSGVTDSGQTGAGQTGAGSV